jgi:plasmid stabilization system protein ParE
MIVRFSPSAMADIQSIYDYRAGESPSSAVETTRELVVPRLPYIAVYHVMDDEVQIIAAFHAAQNVPRGAGWTGPL